MGKAYIGLAWCIGWVFQGSWMKFCRNVDIPKRVMVTAFGLIVRGQMLEGGNVGRFEEQCARLVGKRYGVATSSGRFALYLLFKSMVREPGRDEIILPAFMPWIVARVAVICGLRPVFVDVDPRTRTMDPVEVEKKISERTRVIMAVHLYGVPCEMDALVRIARKHGIVLVENCAQSIGARYHDRLVGSVGDVAVFSFGKHKSCTTYGGGMIVTDDTELHDRLRRQLESVPPASRFELVRRSIMIPLSWSLMTPVMVTLLVHPIYRFRRFFQPDYVSSRDFIEFEEKLEGFDEARLLRENNIRFSHLQATLGLIQLSRLDGQLEAQRRNAEILNAHLPNPPYVPEGVSPSYYMYCVETGNRERVMNALFDEGVLVWAGHFPVIPDLPAFQEYAAECPNARGLVGRLVFLPVQSSLRETDMMRIVKVFERLSD